MAVADTALLERLIGREALETLISVAGGLVVYIPKNPPLDGPLAELPMPAQEALAAWAGGTELYVPKCDGAARAARDAAIRAAYDAGEPVQAIARRYRLTERWIYEILGRHEDDKQGDLF
ncbi:Mor transcription activator family protein [Sulfuritortus calidifontis]|uniref:Mor transcription activator family protein n=1 Tax=Sulfuritortus calidifontis TaxID=1914471 RepID=A0A4V2UQC1_9PROT|nr:Mor transcription activator family protein [Sulfuritortus calidifontis]TCS69748.1 Mor transcription activator family protein [Sulfuritortus calidifontis]